MRIETYIKKIEPKPYDEVMVKLGREEYEAMFIIGLLEELEETGVGMVHVAIHDKQLRETLEKEGIIDTSIGGSSYVANKRILKDLKKKLVRAYDGFHCDEGGKTK